MSKPWLILIESNASGTGRQLAHTATKLGFRPVVLAANPSYYKYLEEDGIDILQVNTQDEQSLLSACYELAVNSKIAGITSTNDYFLETAATLAQHLGLPGVQPNTIHNCRNKHLQLQLLKAADVSIPMFYLASSTEEAVEASQSLEFPVVVKPVSANGSTGVKLCKTLEEVVIHANALLNKKQTDRKLSVSHQILIEELIVGPEYSVEVFGTNIVGITDKYLGPLPYFIEVGHNYPAVLSDEMEKSIHLCVKQTLSALSWEWGPAHVELRFTEEKPKIIEVNPRLGGDHIFDLVYLAHKIDLISETIKLVTGAKPCLEKAADRHASIRFILPTLEGRLKKIENLDFVKQIPEVNEVQIYRQLGDSIHFYGDYRDRVGYVIASSDTSKTTCAVVESAQKAIQLTIEPNLKNMAIEGD